MSLFQEAWVVYLIVGFCAGWLTYNLFRSFFKKKGASHCNGCGCENKKLRG